MIGPGRRYLERKRAELVDDDTFANVEPEPVDVWADQAEANWAGEPRSDDLLSVNARRVLTLNWGP